jgi:murein DD-endopeptidase MepM/ murein hydrolase activator NlpD
MKFIISSDWVFPHRGVDFAVPTGTPILAAGSGRIEMAGWNGNYGRYIRIRHNNTYQTAYAHMSGIAQGIYAGAQVDQGQVIGFVGSTGRSTGPHLHYEILVNRRQVNPMTINLPTGKNLPEREQFRFQRVVDSLHAYIRDNDTTSYAGVTLH